MILNLKGLRAYELYTLMVFLVTYLLNQLDRYMLAITVQPMAQELHFGDQGCLMNSSFTEDQLGDVKCKTTAQDRCEQIYIVTPTTLNTSCEKYVCQWNYTGQGFVYQLLAGPIFIVIFTVSGIFLGFAADRFNRKLMLGGCLIFWSIMTLLTGFVNTYWQLVLLRFGLGLGEGGCTPFVVSMMADIFPVKVRGATLGIYNWGIYLGYSLSFALGNLITQANINGQGWRWAYFISGIPGIVLGILIFLTIKEPERSNRKEHEMTSKSVEMETTKQRFMKILRPFLAPSLILPVLAGSVRNAAGYVFAYNSQSYFTSIGQSKAEIAKFMGWIPLVGGSLGVLVGGFISDRVMNGRGIYARVAVTITSLLVAAPFAAGTLFLSPPWAYIMQIPCFIFGEMWFSITLAVVVEVVPSDIRTSAVAVYLFVIHNIGGNMSLLVPPIQETFENNGYSKSESLRGALYVLYPGLFLIRAILFVPAMFIMKRNTESLRREIYVIMPDHVTHTDSTKTITAPEIKQTQES